MAESSPTSPKPRRTRRESIELPPYQKHKLSVINVDDFSLCFSSLSSSSVSLSEELQCCICLDVFSDPVSTPCGHNFCRICLKQCWDNSQIYSCPYCKETFSKRPELKINTTLREVTLIFKEKFSLRRSEVLCDVCDERKLKALKSCLTCQTSYCKTHLDLHEKINLKKHKLLDPVENIKDYICEKHERPLELFCRDDQTCVCVFCTDGDHKNHNTVPLEEESKEKKVRVHNNINTCFIHLLYIFKQHDLLSEDDQMCLSIDSTDEDTDRHSADDPEENQEDSRHQTLSRTQKKKQRAGESSEC
ncbi:E3 ubiquitin/ISG15 ligase TRIM25 [Misgurnus anguillicaudatus]|uniref:E3 ubiquitin/ISG15 ligase TRIM25 n=1 Tax=Misgurnus anguillicaudatus TaxID=75329 RepID=UPI003CCF94A1